MLSRTKAPERGTPAKVPCLSTYPEFHEPRTKLDELNRMQQELTVEIDQRLANPPQQLVTSAAEALLAGEDIRADPVEGWREELRQMYERRQVVQEAIKIQQRRLRDIRLEVSERVCEDLRPYYRDLQSRIAVALVGLADLADEEWEFRQQLQHHGIERAEDVIGLNPLHALVTRNPTSVTNRFLDQAEKLHGIPVKRRP